MKKIFAYTRAEKFDKKTLDAMVEAGYIPVPVKNFDCVRVLEPSLDLPEEERSLILRCAIKAIKNAESYSDNKSARGFFARYILEEMERRCQPPETPAPEST